jgi:hypothetical protein
VHEVIDQLGFWGMIIKSVVFGPRPPTKMARSRSSPKVDLEMMEHHARAVEGIARAG